MSDANDSAPTLVSGINKGLSNSSYHAEKSHLSSSNLKLLLESPAQFYKEKILGQKIQTSSSAMDIGTYVHSLILEPDKVQDEFAFYTGWRRQGADYEAFKQQHAGKLILSQPQAHNGKRYADSVKACPPALELLQGGEAELSLATTMHDVKLKMRADYLNANESYIVDVKTTRYPSDIDSFKRTVKGLGYELSAALYAAIASQVYGTQFDFYWLVISKSDCETQVYKASLTTMAEGAALVNKALKVYKLCLQNNTWPDTVDEVLGTTKRLTHEILEV